MQENLEWKQHLNTLTPKLNREIKVKTIFSSLFNSHLIYACQIWGQCKGLIEKISAIQKIKQLELLTLKQRTILLGTCTNQTKS